MADGPDDTEPDEPLVGKTPYEPDEFDPTSLGPDVPEVPEPTGDIADSDTATLFVKLVVVFNIALLCLSVGPMLAYFEGRVDLGIRITLLGAVTAGYGLFRYRQFVTGDSAENDPDHNG
ncbi:DUF7322 domain-containing protein [Haloarcula onubensis]|uniref:DUF7322 domain-containing protein n=1 Tax=Haloarcula onubensis TaxID=2950539 RepID=A0ABU2FK85_9EURY|nr:hypothetical protein [Halomicroarcula sp. S3CR25-11]MDS0281158.1 hypothetical protein [Halomicroarcula sp. S3CR25-11]